MPGESFVYTFTFDAASAQASAQRVAQIYQQALASIKVPLASDQAMVAQARSQQAQMTADARANAQARASAARAESQERISAARATANTTIEQEKRTTAIIVGEIRAREREAREAARASQGGGLGGLNLPGMGMFNQVRGVLGGGGGALVGAAGVVGAIGLLGKAAHEAASQIDRQGTALLRTEFSARQLAGSQERLNSLMATYRAAAGGAVTTGESLTAINRLIAIGFAGTEKELAQFVTASRGAALATGQDLQYIQAQLQLSIANQSTMRLDQIGLGVSEVKKRIDELTTANKQLTQEQAYQDAVLGLLNEKYGALVVSAEAGATGLELLETKFRELRETIDKEVTPSIDAFYTRIATSLGTDSTAALSRQLEEMAQYSYNMAPTNRYGGQSAQDIQGFYELAQVLQQVDLAARNGEPGMAALRVKIIELANETIRYGTVSDETANKLDEISRQYVLLQNGGIVLATTNDALTESQARLNEQFAITQGFLTFDYQGTRWAQLPGGVIRPEQGPSATPSDDYFRRQSILQGGGFVTPGGGSIEDFWEQMRDENIKKDNEEFDRKKKEEEQAIAKAERDGEAAAKRTQSAWESAAKKTQAEFERAAKKMASDFESSLRKIPGLFDTTEVTETDIALSKAGIYQPKTDEYLRRLADEVESGQDKYSDVDIKDAARALGVSEALDPKVILAIFKQAWEDSSLFATQANIGKFTNRDAVIYEMEAERRRKLGESNISNWYGMDTGVVQAAGFEGILPGRFQEHLIQGIGEIGGTAGDALADSMFKAFQAQAMGLPWVQELVRTITAQVGRGIMTDLTGNVSSDFATSEAIGEEQ